MKPIARAVAHLLRTPSAAVGAAILLIVLAAAASATWLFPNDPLEMVGAPFTWPGDDADFPAGTDLMGRDILAGLFHGARVSLLVGSASAAIALAIGLLVGAVAGYAGPRTDAVLMRITELFQTVPSFLLAIVLVAILGPSLTTIILALGVTSWTGIARLTRGEFISLREREFVRAAQTLGAGHARIIFLEILPNALPPIIVTTAVLVAQAILSEAGLAFLGLGDPNVVSWGSMVGAGREALRTAWYMTALPGLTIMATVLALNLLSDAINDALNPKLRRQRVAAAPAAAPTAVRDSAPRPS
ncbi:ABC transporter permease [Achromobacter sp.]|uniref:ABC transporter permease n=1 Tax=Achromobacter sp. TaxID=134375 RepID=UPI0028B12AD7|nr:ABC transporter permease [Achromobacter sp.]